MTAIRRSKGDRPLLDSRVAAVSMFAAGLAITVFLSLSAENPDFARARYSVWPVIALGGWAVALMIRHGFTLALGATHWRWWWSAGLAAYAVHLYWGFGAIYAWDLGLVVEGQGA
ncbi:MAG TPA: hypothetical protein VKA18_08995, partial [Alphaproteobacteria bacterium]|nr:hypothetical protein [Alphaproteobacteria bacterium]